MPEPSTMPEPSLMPEPSFEPISKEPPRKSLWLHRPGKLEFKVLMNYGFTDSHYKYCFSYQALKKTLSAVMHSQMKRWKVFVMRGLGSTDVANCAQRITQGLANMPFCTVDISLYAVHASGDGL